MLLSSPGRATCRRKGGMRSEDFGACQINDLCSESSDTQKIEILLKVPWHPNKGLKKCFEVPTKFILSQRYSGFLFCCCTSQVNYNLIQPKTCRALLTLYVTSFSSNWEMSRENSLKLSWKFFFWLQWWVIHSSTKFKLTMHQQWPTKTQSQVAMQ